MKYLLVIRTIRPISQSDTAPHSDSKSGLERVSRGVNTFGVQVWIFQANGKECPYFGSICKEQACLGDSRRQFSSFRISSQIACLGRSVLNNHYPLLRSYCANCLIFCFSFFFLKSTVGTAHFELLTFLSSLTNRPKGAENWDSYFQKC